MTENTATTAPATARGCSCGCGQAVNGKSIFRQGHDARMVSEVAKLTVGGYDHRVPTTHPLYEIANGDMDIMDRISGTSNLIERMFGSALAIKFYNAAMNRWQVTQVRDNKKLERELRATEAAAKLEAKRAARGAKEQKMTEIAPNIVVVGLAETPVEDLPLPGQVKIGRWTYDATRLVGGEVQYVTRDGEVKVADTKVAATFTSD